MPPIICPHCRTENEPAGLSALDCTACGRTIDPRQLGDSAEAFVRRQRRLRKRAKSSVGPLGPEEADELLEWVLDLPRDEMPMEADAEVPSGQSLIGLLAGPWRRLVAVSRRRPDEWLYRDSVVRMSHDAIVIRRYYWPLGRKRIRYGEIRGFTARPLRPWHGQFRIQGVDHRGRWYSRDSNRPEKDRAIDLAVGRVIRPVLTPDDVDTVLEILEREVTSQQA